MPEMGLLERALVNLFFSRYHAAVGLRKVLAYARGPVESPLLEIGCGNGATTEGLLRQLPGVEITAVDYDPDEVALARRRLGDRARIEQGDATDLRFGDATFGMVVSMNVMHHLDYRTALHEVRRVLKRGGQFLFMDYAVGGSPFAPFVPTESRFSAPAFQSSLEKAGFTDIVVSGRLQIFGRAMT